MSLSNGLFHKVEKIMGCLRPILVCTCNGSTCGAAKMILDLDKNDKLM